MSQKIQKKIVLNVKTLDINAGNCMIPFSKYDVNITFKSQSACLLHQCIACMEYMRFR